MGVCGVSTVLNNSKKARNPDSVCLLMISYAAISWLGTQILGKQLNLHRNHEITAFLSTKAIQEAESRSIQVANYL